MFFFAMQAVQWLGEDGWVVVTATPRIRLVLLVMISMPQTLTNGSSSNKACFSAHCRQMRRASIISRRQGILSCGPEIRPTLIPRIHHHRCLRISPDDCLILSRGHRHHRRTVFPSRMRTNYSSNKARKTLVVTTAEIDSHLGIHSMKPLYLMSSMWLAIPAVTRRKGCRISSHISMPILRQHHPHTTEDLFLGPMISGLNLRYCIFVLLL